jgi:hypothetical protein
MRYICAGSGSSGRTRRLASPVTGPHIVGKTARVTTDPASYFASDAFRQLDADCAGALTREDVHTVLLSLGGDGVQLLNWGSRTATVAGIKCEDLPRGGAGAEGPGCEAPAGE